MKLSSKIQTLNYSEDINDVLSQISNKLSLLASNKLQASKYGSRDITDMESFFILSRYQDILLRAANKSSCFCGYLVDDIISIVKQYLSSSSVQKF